MKTIEGKKTILGGGYLHPSEPEIRPQNDQGQFGNQGQFENQGYVQGQFGNEGYDQGQFGNQGYVQGQFGNEGYYQGQFENEGYYQGQFENQPLLPNKKQVPFEIEEPDKNYDDKNYDDKKKNHATGGLIALLLIVIVLAILIPIYLNKHTKKYKLSYCTTCQGDSVCQSLTEKSKRCNYCRKVSYGIDYYADNPCFYGKGVPGYVVPRAYNVKEVKTAKTRHAGKKVRHYKIPYPGQNVKKTNGWICVGTDAICKNCKDQGNTKWEPKNAFNENYYSICKNCSYNYDEHNLSKNHYTTCTENGKKCDDHN